MSQQQLQQIIQRLEAQPIALSPWIDLEGLGDSMKSRVALDPIVQKESLLEMAKHYLAGLPPLQFTCALSRRGRDFDGGDLLLVEQRPRAQSRGEAIALDAGEGIIFANRYRPAAGAKGFRRVNLRHGVSTVKSGVRYAMGVIFHDAA